MGATPNAIHGRLICVLTLALTLVSVAGMPARAAQPAADAQATAAELERLEDRLRDTDAIGLFAKLDLQAQLDALVDDLDRHHRGESSVRLEVLEGRFQRLLHQVLGMLREANPDLHRDIHRARLRLWANLYSRRL